VLLAVGLAASVLSCAKPGYKTVSLFSASTVPKVTADPDTKAVILATRVRASVAGDIGVLKFYRSKGNVGTHVGYVWDANGRLLTSAKFPETTSVGWKHVVLSKPVHINAGQTFVVGYLAPKGQYASDTKVFSAGRTVAKGPLTAIGSAYSYTGSFPVDAWEGANYYVDLDFTYKSASTSTTTTTTRPTTTTTTTTTSRPTTTSSTTTQVPTTSSTTTTTSTTLPTNPGKVLDLPKIPWAGGPAYWAKFPDAKAAGWDRDTFFPVGAFWAFWPAGNGADAHAAVAWDKAHGINFYTEGNSDQDACVLRDVGGMSWIGGPNSISNLGTCGGSVWPGTFLEDEVDGRYSESAGKALLAGLRDQLRAATPGKAIFNNYTGMVLQTWYADTLGEGYVNDYQDATSLDIYYATDTDYACVGPDWWPFSVMPAPAGGVARCRDAQSYGKAIDGLRVRDAADGKSQPLAAFVENGAVRESAPMIPAAKMKAAVMSTLIHGAGYVIYFNTSWGSCPSNNMIREAQNGKACAQPNVAAMGEVNKQIQSWAPILNTQSYQWTFGTGLDTMLKVKDGYAYILAMTEGGTGARTFTLPAGLTGNVTDETGRTLTVSGGKFTDTFEANTEYHLYRIALA
jgi:Domain of unknown function (DUF4082)